jgi:4-amino-4-deoxy-L-arabinose transferase-like glycosyltransferase
VFAVCDNYCFRNLFMEISDPNNLILAAGIFMVLSIYFFRKKRKLSLCLLFLGALSLGFFTATLDPFLNVWDEQYHALVAKSLMRNPLQPMLFPEHLMPFDSNVWTYNTIWLHKQPLFLWQIALSLKVFGLSALSVRIPSVVLFAIMPLLVYRIGKLALNERIGFIAALLMASAHFVLELIAGNYSTDHNDVAFLFYVLASFWAYWEYKSTGRLKWLLLVGVFSGGAVLVKWLLGLLIFPTWFFSHIIANKEKRFYIPSYFPIAGAFGVALLVFLPWQIYIFSAYPNEAAHEMELTSRHLVEVIEGHSEERFYFFKEGLRNIYGRGALVPYVVLAGLILLLVRLKDRFSRSFFIIPIVIVYSVYTIAETKMPAFPVVLIWLGMLALASFIYAFYGILKCWISNLPLRNSIATVSILFVLYMSIDLVESKKITFIQMLGGVGNEN